jgi:hypothetical protein
LSSARRKPLNICAPIDAHRVHSKVRTFLFHCDSIDDGSLAGR